MTLEEVNSLKTGDLLLCINNEGINHLKIIDLKLYEMYTFTGKYNNRYGNNLYLAVRNKKGISKWFHSYRFKIPNETELTLYGETDG